MMSRLRDFPRRRFHGAGFVECIGMHDCPLRRASTGVATAPVDRLAGNLEGRGWTL